MPFGHLLAGMTLVMRLMSGSSLMPAVRVRRGWKGLDPWDSVVEASEVQGLAAELTDLRLWDGLTAWFARRDACKSMQMSIYLRTRAQIVIDS